MRVAEAIGLDLYTREVRAQWKVDSRCRGACRHVRGHSEVGERCSIVGRVLNLTLYGCTVRMHDGRLPCNREGDDKRSCGGVGEAFPDTRCLVEVVGLWGEFATILVRCAHPTCVGRTREPSVGEVERTPAVVGRVGIGA